MPKKKDDHTGEVDAKDKSAIRKEETEEPPKPVSFPPVHLPVQLPIKLPQVFCETLNLFNLFVKELHGL